MNGDLTLSEKRAIAGRKGGRATVKRYGKRYMKRLAKWAAHRMHAKYALVPVDLNDFAGVNKETGEVRFYLSGKSVGNKARFLEIPVDVLPDFLLEA